jgi:predicted transcriptional regulator
MHTAPTTTVAVKLEHEIKERLQKLGQLKHRSAHWLMKQAITAYLEYEEQAEQLKQETLARWQEAESGKIVSHEAVSAWLDTWGTENEIGRPTCGS